MCIHCMCKHEQTTGSKLLVPWQEQNNKLKIRRKAARAVHYPDNYPLGLGFAKERQDAQQTQVDPPPVCLVFVPCTQLLGACRERIQQFLLWTHIFCLKYWMLYGPFSLSTQKDELNTRRKHVYSSVISTRASLFSLVLSLPLSLQCSHPPRQFLCSRLSLTGLLYSL